VFLSYGAAPDVKLGLAMTGNFGLAQKYDGDWVGRYYVQEATLIGMPLLPAVAWRIGNQVSVGAGLNLMYGVLKQQVAVNNIAGPDGRLALDTRQWGYGANLGLLYEPGPNTRFGVVYNSQVKLDFSSPAEFSDLSPALPSNSAWRFGLGLQNDERRTFAGSVSAEYVYGGTLDVNRKGAVPVAAGGRGDLVGSFDGVGMYFVAATFGWKL
jgi:long-chain fatty acid transport protein